MPGKVRLGRKTGEDMKGCYTTASDTGLTGCALLQEGCPLCMRSPCSRRAGHEY